MQHERNYPSSEQPEELRIDSGTFLRYILPTEEQLESSVPQASVIDLSLFTASFQEVAETIVETPITTQEWRDELERNHQTFKDTSTPSLSTGFFDQIFEHEKKHAQTKAPAERGRYYFYRFSSNELIESTVLTGELDQVNLDTEEFEDEELDPIFSVHTHPRDELFSFQDYHSLLLNVGLPGSTPYRYEKAKVVLCPHIQFLAVTTPETPTLSFEETTELISSKEAELETLIINKLGSLHKKIAQVPFLSASYAAKLTQEASQLLGEYLEAHPDHSEEEQLTMSEEIFKLKKEDLKKFSSRLIPVSNAMNIRFQQAATYIVNQELYRFARDFNIQLFASVDAKIFEKTPPFEELFSNEYKYTKLP